MASPAFYVYFFESPLCDYNFSCLTMITTNMYDDDDNDDNEDDEHKQIN